MHIFAKAATLLMMAMSASADKTASEKLIFPEDISPEDFESLQRKPCSDRRSQTWCLNDFQPDGGCKWRVSARQSVRPHQLHAKHQSRLVEQAVKTDTVTAGVLTDMVAEVDGFTFRGVGHCTSPNGNTFGYERAVSRPRNVQLCAEACVNRFSSSGRFLGINYLPATKGSSSNCNCMLGRDFGERITSTRRIGTELCYSWDGVDEKPEPDPADSPRYPDCQDRMDKQECIDGYDDKKCVWYPGRPVGLCEDAPKETFKTPCSRNGWQGCQNAPTCRWVRGDGCVRAKPDPKKECVANNRSDCSTYCRHGPTKRGQWHSGHDWSYDRDSFKCVCHDGRKCEEPRNEGEDSNEEHVSADYFDSNSADHFEEE